MKTSKQSPELDTQLLLAARKGSLGRASLLIKAGANLEARNRDGWTPLLLSVRQGYTDIASLLLEAGANVNAKTDSERTALHLAAENGLEDLTRQLLTLGANVHAEDAVNKRSALYYAVFYGEAAIVKLLLDAGADPNARGYGEGTPLNLAMNQGSKEVQAVITHIRRKTLPSSRVPERINRERVKLSSPLKPLETPSRKRFWKILNPS